MAAIGARLAFLVGVIATAAYLYFKKENAVQEPEWHYFEGKPACNPYQQAIKDAFVWSWNGYRKYAWGDDIYHPVTKRGDNMARKPLGWIIVDSLDSLMMMGLDEQVAEAREWITKDLDYNIQEPVSVFETTIRMVGGLLSAYYLSNDQLYLDKAVQLADRILPAFETATGVPTEDINLSFGASENAMRFGTSSTAEVATVQMELKYLSHLTGDAKYWKAAEKVMQVIEGNRLEAGLAPIFISPQSGRFTTSEIRLGSRGDSYYEYLIKQYLQTSQKEEVYRNMYDETVQGIKDHMFGHSVPHNLTFIGELPRGIHGGEFSTKMDHLVCFAGGMFAIGATNGKSVLEAKQEGWTELQQQDFQLGVDLTRACVETYLQTATGLGPEIVVFNTEPGSKRDFYIKPRDTHNLQRPETVESLFILWRLTGDPIWREWGWKIFQAFQEYSLLPGDAGYSCLRNVEEKNGERIDNMESFWLAETLKYLWLLFDDNDTLPLDQIVFNTEAHPLPVIDAEFTTGWERVNPFSPVA